MFLPPEDRWPRSPWRFDSGKPKLNKSQQKALVWVIALIFLLDFIAPIAGSTWVDVFSALSTR